MYTYIKKDIIGNYIESDVLIDTIPGYEGAVGISWKDYMNGKFLILNDRQLEFRKNNPEASLEEIYNMELIKPEIPEEPVRTLEDAKRELHEAVDAYSDSLKVFYVNGEAVWFDNRPSLKLQVEAEATYNQENVTLYINDQTYTLPIADANNAILSVEHYNTQCLATIKELHDLVDSIDSLEIADNVDINHIPVDVPAPPQFVINGSDKPETPAVTAFNVVTKLVDCWLEDTVYEVEEGASLQLRIVTHNNYALYRSDIVCEMNGAPAEIIFKDDQLERPEYACCATIEIPSVTGEVFIAGIAHPMQSVEPEPREVKDFYSIVYNTIDCNIDNDIYEVAYGSAWKTSVFPNKGLAIYVPEFSATMGNDSIKVYFEPDTNDRPDYAAWARIEVPEVYGDIVIAATAK